MAPMTKQPEQAAPDRGCGAWPRCTTCIFSVCVAELPHKERNELHAALRLVKRYLAAPDGTISI
jgi:hypothetical protein